MIKILIVDDNLIVRNGLRTLLDGEADILVTGTAETGDEALRLLSQSPEINVLLVDFNMPDMDGAELTRRITAIYQNAKIIILTMHRQETFLKKTFEAGANGYLLKGEDEQELIEAIRSVHNGHTFITSNF